MNILKSSIALAACLLCAPTVYAASPTTEMFLANVTPNVDFLDRSSRLALENSASARLKEFARTQAVSQTLAANAIFDASQKIAASSDQLQTGRSVATVAPAADLRLPLGQEDLDSIEGLQGVEFDEAFRAKQRSALAQIQVDYETYLATGDDAALKAIAAKELPIIKKQLAALSKA